MKDSEELEMLLDEIPQATSNHLHQHQHHQLHLQHDRDHGGGDGDHVSFVKPGMYGIYDGDPFTRFQSTNASSPVYGYSPKSDGSSSSAVSGGHPLSDNASPIPPPLEEHKPKIPSGSNTHLNKLWLDSKTPDSPVRKTANENFVDELNLSANLNKMHISNKQENACSLNSSPLDCNAVPFQDCFCNGMRRDFDYFNRGFSDFAQIGSPLPRSVCPEAEMNLALSALEQEYAIANFLGSRLFNGSPDGILQLNGYGGLLNPPRQRREPLNGYYHRGGVHHPLDQNSSFRGISFADNSIYARNNGMSLLEERGLTGLSNVYHLGNVRPYSNAENNLQYGIPLSHARSKANPNNGIPKRGNECFFGDGSFIIQGEDLNSVVNKEYNPFKFQGNGARYETTFGKHMERFQPNVQDEVYGNGENTRGGRLGYPLSTLPKYNSLAEVQDYIYLTAKDQNGCRLLQRLFDEGTPRDIQIIFNEIINHVVELMMNPFGNYLMQKLLDVCNEEQRMQILLMVTKEPGQLVRISLNTHGTRVVQKLIETLKTKNQVSLVVSALEPGFLALIKDLNGNHVVQRCLQCLNNEDNKFIYVAAAKYCVDIATHQHGCCVLQRCISHSVGEHRDILVAEISANGLLLAQDAYGNYVVQFILELKIPSANTSLISQFESNYIHLSSQKFSSHVVEKCLVVFDNENRSKIINELLSTPHFEQLLQDPHANYVVQTALRVSEGPIHKVLVEAIESHKALSRNSPYSKRIFSQRLFKK